MLGAQHHFESCRFKDAPSRTHQHTQGHFLKGIIFLKSFNSAHGDGVLLLAVFCWWHCFLTVLVAVAGLLSTPFSLSLSFPVDL